MPTQNKMFEVLSSSVLENGIPERLQQAVPVPDYCQSEGNPLRHCKFPVQYVTLSSYLVAIHLWGSLALSCTVRQVYNFLPKLCLLQSEQDLLHEPLLTGQVLHPPTALMTSAEISPIFQCLFDTETVQNCK